MTEKLSWDQRYRSGEHLLDQPAPLIAGVADGLIPARALDLSARGLAGVVASVFLGGTVVLVVTRLVAVLLIHLGLDVERTWVDEVLGAAAGAGVLHYFGNDPLSRR